MLSYEGIVPPMEWHHDPTLESKYYTVTVAKNLLMNNILPPKEWEHILKLRYISNYKKKFLIDNGYTQIGYYYIPPNYL